MHPPKQYRDATTDGKYQGWLTQATPERPARRDILYKINIVMADHTARHSKTFFMMFTLNFPLVGQYPVGNETLTLFLKHFIPALEREALSPSYVWARENSLNSSSDSPRHHYHLLLLLNGQHTRMPHNHIEKAKYYWAKALGLADASGLVEFGAPGDLYAGAMMLPNSPDFQSQYWECFARASYIAKVHSKGSSPRVRDFSGSSVGQIQR